MRRIVGMFILLALLTGSGLGRAASPPKSIAPRDAGIDLATSEKGLETGQSLTEFDLFALRDRLIIVLHVNEHPVDSRESMYHERSPGATFLSLSPS
jgi:hypothetical protein